VGIKERGLNKSGECYGLGYILRARKTGTRASSSLNVERKFYEFPPIVSEFRDAVGRGDVPTFFARQRASSIRERKKWEKKKRREKREKGKKNDRDFDYVADAPQEFVVCVFRYELARARVHRSAAGIVIYERSFVEFADDILPRGRSSWPVAARSCNVVYRTSVDFDTSCAIVDLPPKASNISTLIMAWPKVAISVSIVLSENYKYRKRVSRILIEWIHI